GRSKVWRSANTSYLSASFFSAQFDYLVTLELVNKKNDYEKYIWTEIDGYSCLHCNKKKYKYKQHLKTHLKTECLQWIRYKCELCSIDFSRKIALIMHYQSEKHQKFQRALGKHH
ncbi:hypothetical protein HHI36_020026, partial [Cryptolaemus montrouzieri]